MASSTLTLWDDAMAENAIIEKGELLHSTAVESDECDDEHDLFGGLQGSTCGEYSRRWDAPNAPWNNRDTARRAVRVTSALARITFA